jgi:two-component system, chemotaxis family, protein-glutamate methylesterase/glutaminase
MPEAARLLIVDDSRIFRAALEQALAGEEGVAVVGSVFSGTKALEFVRGTPPDVVTLDVEMPGLDGLQTLEAIQRLNATRPKGAEVGVIMVSAFTRRGADVTVRALQAGAFDFVTKPSGESAEASLATLRQQLVAKIRLFLARRGSPHQAEAAPLPAAGPEGRQRWLESAPGRPVRAVLIATSTGGPKALDTLLPDLCSRTDVPVLVVQHMKAGFLPSLVESLARRVPGTVALAGDGDVVRRGTVYVAPDDRHLLLRSEGGRLLTALNEQPPENGFRPSADVLFRSAAVALGGSAVAVVLTGMTCASVADGTAGLRPLQRAGAYVLAQDEATSTVWGMPGSAVKAGLVDEVLPLDRIAAAVHALVAGRGAK